MARKKALVDRRDRIIQAADSLFNQRGYDKTTMEDISRASGVPRATIYLEFSGGKEDILMASIECYFQRLLERFRELIKVSRAGRLETLKQLILYNILANYDRTVDYQHETNHLYKYRQRVFTEMHSFFQARRELFTEVLKQAVIGGEISEDYECSRLAEIITQGMAAFMPPICVGTTRDQLEQNASAFFTLLLSGVSKNQRVLSRLS